MGSKEKKKKEIAIPDMHLVENEMQRLGVTPNKLSVSDILKNTNEEKKKSKKDSSVKRAVSTAAAVAVKETVPAAVSVSASVPGVASTSAAEGTEEHSAGIPGMSAVENEIRRINYRKRYLHTLWTTLCVIVIAAAIAVLVATMFTPVLQVSGSSMEPTLEDNNIVILLNKSGFKTGDLVGFYYQNKILLKRVIAGPGDVVDIDEAGNVMVNNVLLDEPYVTNKALGDTDRTYPYQVADDRYFVMGDNRLTSIDSRNTAIGCIETDQIVGKVVFRVWPLNSISTVK